MAEKHKSKYKAPKDLEKSQKPKPRKDLKSYTHDDKKGGLNPKSTGDKQLNVLRKTDKTMQDDGKYDVKYNADDRLYDDLENGEWEPKTAAKRLKKRQDAEEKEISDVIKDKIENLTREQHERLVREYVRRKIVKTLLEQEDKTAEETPEETPKPEGESTPPPPSGAPAPEGGETPPPSPGGAPNADATATPPAPAAPATPAPSAAPSTAAPETKPAETPEDKAQEKIAKQKVALKYWEETLADQSGPNMLVDTGFDPLAKALANLGAKDLKLAKVMILRRLSKIKPATASNTQETK